MQDTINSIKHFFDRKSRILFITAFGLTILFSLLLFNFRVSEGGDDSSYIFGAWKFMRGETFPQWHGTFYQIVLGIVILFFGKDLLILKLTSLMFMLFFFVWIYRTFKNKIPAYVLFIGVFLISINSHILIYSSLTYSEALYMALQIACLYMFFNIASKIETEHNYFKFWKEWLIFGLLMVMLYLTRSVGIAMFISVAFYFFISKKHKAILFTVLPFVMFYFIFFIYKVVFWKTTSIGIESQSAVFYLKDPYNASAGNEDLTGYFFRFINNIYQYLYEHFFAMNGINVGHISKLNVFFAIIFLILLINAFIVFMKSNKLFYIIGIYLLTALGITFITVQTFWNQERLIMVYYPFLVIILFYALDKSMSKRKALFLKILPFVIGCIVLLLVLINSLKETGKTVPVLAKNVSGNTYYGYERGWDNYLKLSEWCGNNLKTSDIVGCRNPTMSFIYSKNKEYSGIYGFPAMSVDSFLYSVKNFSKVIIIDLDELLLDKIKDDEKQYLRKNIWGLMMCKKRRVGVIQADSTNTGTLMEIINKYDLSYTNDISNLSNLTTYGYVNAVIPDNLVEMLKKQKLDYLLDGTIGFVENNKEHYVNTIFRIIFFINQKYPDLFEVIRNEGKDYPATLYKIHWEKD